MGMPAEPHNDPRRTTPVRDLTWECHICGATRPDVFISVMRRPLERPPTPGSRANIRFCNDRAGCATTAATMLNFGGIKLLPGVASS
jgi:hypothetical protein